MWVLAYLPPWRHLISSGPARACSPLMLFTSLIIPPSHPIICPYPSLRYLHSSPRFILKKKEVGGVKEMLFAEGQLKNILNLFISCNVLSFPKGRREISFVSEISCPTYLKYKIKIYTNNYQHIPLLHCNILI